MDTPCPAVYEAIRKVSAELAKTGIGKTGRNVQQNYAFRGVEQVLNALVPALVTHGLVVLPRMVSRECVERTTAKGSLQFFVTVCAEFDFVAVSDGSKHTVVTYGEAQDTADKATNKAMSAAYKYAAFLAFCIPMHGVMEDADATTGEESVQAAPAFDVARYDKWVQELGGTAKEAGYEALVADVKGGPQAFQDRLRSDKKTWLELKALAPQREAVTA